MQLKVTHQTVYNYDEPARFGIQSLRLTPSVFQGQKVVDWKIDMGEVGEAGANFRDGAGDTVQLWSLRKPATQVPVNIKGVVETTDLSGVLKGHREIIHPMVYLQNTDATMPDEQLRETAGSASAQSSLELAHELSQFVYDKVAYKSGVTSLKTSAAEALSLGCGVCQDHAHILITLARLRNLPARYVSGYLYADADGNTHEAAHAWAEIHIEGLGWIGFDAANNTCPNDNYIRTGSGFDAFDAAPIRGVMATNSTENLSVTVAVERLDA